MTFSANILSADTPFIEAMILRQERIISFWVSSSKETPEPVAVSKEVPSGFEPSHSSVGVSV